MAKSEMMQGMKREIQRVRTSCRTERPVQYIPAEEERCPNTYVDNLNTCFRPIFDKATALKTRIACPFRPSEAPRFSKYSIRFGCDVGQI